MGKRRILWAVVLGLTLAVTGCGDDETTDNGDGGSGGSGGSSGSGGTGGSGGMAGSGGTGGSSGMGGNGGATGATSTCEAVCAAPCIFGGLDPSVGFEACMTDCLESIPMFDDECGPEAEAFIGCCEDNACICEDLNCVDEAGDWNACTDA